MRLLREYLRPYRGTLVLVVVLLVIQTAANLYIPTLNAEIINRGVVTGDIPAILRIGALMLGVTLVLVVSSVIAVYYSARTSMAFGRDVRRAVFARATRFSLAEMDRFGPASLITRCTNDVQQVQMLVLIGLTMLVMAPLMAVGGVIMAARVNLRLSSLLLVVVPIMAIVVGGLMVRALPLFRSMQGRIDRVNAVLRESLTGVRVIRAFVRTGHEERRFDEANIDLTDTALRVNRLFALMLPALMLVMNLSSVAVLWFGGRLVDDGAMQVGDLTAFLQYLVQILFAVMMAVMIFVMVPRAAASAERIEAVLQASPGIIDPATPQPFSSGPACGTVEFDHVTFSYPGAEAPVFADVTFTARPGQLTAIVGGTGAGKTTALSLVPRLHDVTQGAVRIGGVDVRDMALEDLWAHIAWVPQRATLFSGTVADNVRFGDEAATDDQVRSALADAAGLEFVEAMPGGLDAEIDQGGANLSGGQRQRLAIARAIVRDAPVYLFDDSFSALDYVTDAAVRTALRRRLRDATVIVVAQRISSILAADQIVVLDNGAVVGIGRHQTLLQDCPTYREIVESQLQGEPA